MKRQLCYLTWSKTIHRLRLWRTPPHQMPPSINAKRAELWETCGSSGESLLAGELSDGSWRSHETTTCTEVPKGFLALYVGPELRRFVIPLSYLSTPDFKVIMDRAAEEFGYEQEGGIRIPCEEEDFEKILWTCLANNKKKNNIKKV